MDHERRGAGFYVLAAFFALFVLKSDVGEGDLIFDIAAVTIIASILAHGIVGLALTTHFAATVYFLITAASPPESTALSAGSTAAMRICGFCSRR